MASVCRSDDRLLVFNDFGKNVTFWIKSEHKQQWNRIRMAPNQRAVITLVSPDRFELVASDLQGNEYYAGDLKALHEMAQQGPDVVLRLKPVFETRTREELAYDRSRYQWRKVLKTQIVSRMVFVYPNEPLTGPEPAGSMPIDAPDAPSPIPAPVPESEPESRPSEQ